MTAQPSRQPHPLDWRPNSGPQTDFLTRVCFEALYGGSAGGGKSDALLVDALRYVGRGYGTSYHAILFRRSFPELEKTLIKRSWDIYPHLGGWYNEQKKLWRFPGGERVEFAHLEHENDVHLYQGAEFQYVGFDELTLFSENQYLYLFSRCRSSKGIRCRIRAGTNPGNEGHEWVFKRWGAWLDPEYPVHATPGQELSFLRRDDVEILVPRSTRFALDRTFIPARLEDNPVLFNDGQYESKLLALDIVQRERLRSGNWLIKPAKGLYFRRDWFTFVNTNEVPRDCRRYRYWDLAATEAESGKDPDWTSGARVAIDKNKRVYIEDVARMRGNPGDVERFVKATAEMDGAEIPIGMEQEPGASGKAGAAAYVRLLAGYTFKAFNKRIKKVVAAGPISAQANARNVCIVRGPWNEPVLRTLEQFPEGGHDDDVDSISGAYSALLDTPLPWGGILDFYREEAANLAANSAPKAPEAAARGTDLTALLVPNHITGTISARGGSYVIEDHIVRVHDEDVEDLIAVGFTIA